MIWLSLSTSVITGLYMWLLARGDKRGWWLALAAQGVWLMFIVQSGGWGLLPLTAWLTFVAIKGLRK